LAANASASTAELSGRALDGAGFSLDAQRGKVVLVVFWATGCPVCRDVMPELRANYGGWKGKPFELVTVATDARRADVMLYEQARQLLVPAADRFPMLWRGEAGHRDGFGTLPTLPAAYVIDAQGRIVERFAGRVPPEAWDRIAELMP